MIHSLYGEIVGTGVHTILLRSGPVEWHLTVSNTTLGAFGGSGDREVRVFTWLHHKEDTMQLFGFATLMEREIFQQLIGVSGVGPKQAIRILSGMSTVDFVRALETEDVAGISSIKGLGTKGAQKIILALRGKLVSFSEEPVKQEKKTPFEVPVAALVEMGFDRREVLRVVEDLGTNHPQGTMSPWEYEELLFREALIRLS